MVAITPPAIFGPTNGLRSLGSTPAGTARITHARCRKGTGPEKLKLPSEATDRSGAITTSPVDPSALPNVHTRSTFPGVPSFVVVPVIVT